MTCQQIQLIPFDLDLRNLTKGYPKLMLNILKALQSEVDHHWSKQPALQRQPSRVAGKLYTSRGGVFSSTHTWWKMITLLFRWSNLYFLRLQTKATRLFISGASFNMLGKFAYNEQWQTQSGLLINSLFIITTLVPSILLVYNRTTQSC